MKKRALFLIGLVLAACSNTPLQHSDSLEIPVDSISEIEAESPDLSAQVVGDWRGKKVIPTLTQSATSDISVNSSGVAFISTMYRTYRVSSSGAVTPAFAVTEPNPNFPSGRIEFKAVATDTANNGYVVGTNATRNGGGARAYIAKVTGLRTTPQVVWEKFWGNQISLQDPFRPGDNGAIGVGADSSGNVYVGGFTCNSLTVAALFDAQTTIGACDQFVTKFNAAGTRVWSRILGTTSDETPGRISVTNTGKVYVTGTTQGAMPGNTNAGGKDIYIAKYDTNGNRLWIKQFGTPQDDIGKDIEVDFNGGLYVAGSSRGALNASRPFTEVIAGVTYTKPQDGILMRLSLTGVLQWTQRSSAAYVTSTYPRDSNSSINDITVDAGNNVYVTGEGFNAYIEDDDTPWPLKFNSAGTLLRKGQLSSPQIVNRTAFGNGKAALDAGPSGVYLTIYGLQFDPPNTTNNGKYSTNVVRHNFNLVLQ